MKTSETKVIVAVLDNGKNKRHIYPIVGKNGELMTHRLRKLLSGHLGRSHNDAENGPEEHEIHFVGMVWRPPYTLLQEVTQDRLALQKELLARAGHSHLTDIPPIAIPEKASSGKITTLLQSELATRHELKIKLRALGLTEEDLSNLTQPKPGPKT